MKIIGLIILVLIGYWAWRFVVRGDALVLTTPDRGRRVSGKLKRPPRDGALVIEVDNPGKVAHLTQISVARELAERLGLGPPTGFRAEPLPLNPRERKDKEMVDFVARYNREHLRWVGKQPLAANAGTEVVFPAGAGADPEGTIEFQYESRFGPGSSISAFWVDLGAQSPALNNDIGQGRD